jgi:hypothetical protein
VPALADDFDRLDGAALTSIPGRSDAKPHDRLTLAELGALPNLVRGVHSGLIVIKTDQGNLARVLAAPALRKPLQGEAEPVPVLLLERFATFETPRATTRLARGQDLMLFDGFRFDLDSGQVVPEGQGGDLQFLTSKPEGPRVESIGGAKMYTISSSPIPPAERGTGPSPGREVRASDFNGHYRLFANGQWSGMLELKVDAEGVVGGSFRSDLQGTAYPVKGQVAADLPRRIQFTVKYPRSQHDFDGYLWTEGKGAMAGTVTLLDHPYGFFALREGAEFAPEGALLGPKPARADRERTVVRLTVEGSVIFEGKEISCAELTDLFRPRASRTPDMEVEIRAPGKTPFIKARQVVDALKDAGVVHMHLSQEPEEK